MHAVEYRPNVDTLLRETLRMIVQALKCIYPCHIIDHGVYNNSLFGDIIIYLMAAEY
jgi:hypothetical protein